MSGVSLGKSHGRPHAGKKTLRRCHDGAGADHVVLIDVECETFSNVIFIDVPESTPKKFRAKTAAKKDKRRSPLRNIIFIDDDETNDNEYPEFDVEDDHHFFHDPSPSMRPCSTSKSAKEPLDEIGDDCQFVRENICPVKLSKCKRTYSGKAPVQNRYGLMCDSESSSSDDDEFMEDYSGQLREQWQKASLKRKNDNCGQSGVRDINSASTVEIQPEPGESEEHPACSGYSKSSTEKEDLSPKPTCESRCTSRMADVHDEGDPQMENFEESYPSIPREYQQHPFVKKHSEQGNEGSIPAAGSRLEKPVSCGDRNFSWSCRRYRVAEEEPRLDKHQHDVETENGMSRYISADTSEFGANHNETQPRNRGSFVEEDLSESVSMSQHKDERHDDVNGQDGENVELHVENCITTERERIKETSEYKKALEEEMASRQRALATQVCHVYFFLITFVEIWFCVMLSVFISL